MGIYLLSKIKIILFCFIGLVIISQYTNCDNFDDLENTLRFNSGLCFEKNECEVQSSAKLVVKSKYSTLQASRLNQSAVVTGECSTGNFNNHNIEYKYFTDNRPAGSGERLINNGCVNGKFIISLDLGSSYKSYSHNDVGNILVEVKIFGIDDQGKRIEGTHPNSKEQITVLR